MKTERFKRTKTVVATGAVALVVAAATFGVASVVVGSRNVAQHLGFDLASSSCPANPLTPPSFSVCGPSIGHGPVVYPSAPAATLPLTFYNPLAAGLSVGDLSVTFTNSFPPGCAASAYRINGTTVTGVLPSVSGSQPNVTLTFATSHRFSVPGGSVAHPGMAVYDLTLGMLDQGDQTACEGLALAMHYNADANYSEIYNTATVVTSDHNPAVIGQNITYTATVTANAGAGQDPVPSSPTGTVTFKDNGTTIGSCANLPVTSTGTTTSTVACPISYPSTAGSPHPITAVYTDGADGNFNGSASNALSETVNPTVTTLTLTTTPSGSAHFGQSVTLEASISPSSGPTGTVTFFLGTPSVTHASLGTGTLSLGQATLTTAGLPPGGDSLYAVYGGATNYAASTSPMITLNVGFSVACINNTVNGGYTVPAGQSICITGRVNGGVTVSAGASLFLNGAAINGGVISTAGANALRFCGSTINGNDNIQNSTGFVLVGDGGDVASNGDDLPPACAGNTFNTAATLTFVNNHGGLEFGGNTVGGILNITGNTASSPQEVEANTITGTLTCGATNNPALTDAGLKNTVVGIRAGQCAGANF